MLGRIFKRKARTSGWAALKFVGERGVQVACVTGGDTARPRVQCCDYVPLGAGGRGLDSLRRSARLDRYACSTLLEGGTYQMLSVDAPNVPDAETRSAVRWRLKDLLDYPVDQATIDVLRVPPGDGGKARSLLAVAVQNDVLKAHTARIIEADIRLRAVDVPEMAQRNLSTLHDPRQGVALLAFDATGGLLTVAYRGELYMSRRIDVTLGQLQDASEALRAEHFDRIALQLQRSFDYVDRQFGFITLAGLVLAPLPESIPLRDYLSANLGLPAETLNLAQILDVDAVPELLESETQGEFFHVLGAALRWEEMGAAA